MYDLILRDATIVSPRGRLVADVAIEAGKIVYVGPRPPKSRTRDEISAIGRFLMPGVIDTGVQFAPNGDPTAWERESRAAVTGGVTTVIAQPGGDHPVADLASARARHDRIARGSWSHYGLWAQATGDNANELRSAFNEGLILGALAQLEDPSAPHPTQITTSKVLEYLDHPGVLGLQLAPLLDRPEDRRQLVHQIASRSVHLLHLSTADELQLLDPVHGETQLTASVTPHHLFLNDSDTELLNGATTSPPPRPETDRRTLWTAVKRGRLDCLASDHHPTPAGTAHIGIPSAELLLPLLLASVHKGRISLERMVELCSEAPARVFGLSSKGQIATGFDADLVLFTEGQIDRVDAPALLSGAGWSPYADREVAPKPDIVLIGGQVVARRGFVVGEAPCGRAVRAG